MCQNGSSLHAEETLAAKSCHYCDCIDGWRGIECGLCPSVDVCLAARPPGGGDIVDPIGCSNDRIDVVPGEIEWHGFKVFDCSCGGDDPSTKWVCGQSVGYNYQVKVFRDDDGALRLKG